MNTFGGELGRYDVRSRHEATSLNNYIPVSTKLCKQQLSAPVQFNQNMLHLTKHSFLK